MSITNYQVVYAARDAVEELAAKVNAAIANGWQPHGAPIVTDHLTQQAMIKGTPDGGSGGGGSDYVLPAATLTDLGGVKLAAAIEDSSAADAEELVGDYNALLAALRTAGILAPSA